MESLLRWGIENSAPSDGTQPSPARRQDMDPGVIDLILGKSDAELMKEALAIAVDTTQGEEDRVAALDKFEMLVENIDNAIREWHTFGRAQTATLNCMDLLTSACDESLKVQTLWVIGTAIQNNPAAQSAYLSLAPMSVLVSFLYPHSLAPTRSKAVYALSGLLKHNAAAVAAFESADGWNVLRALISDSDITVRRKTAFLLNSLLISNSQPNPPPSDSATNPSAAPIHPNSHASMLRDPRSTETSSPTLKALRQYGLLPALISELVAPTPYGADGETEGDLDFEEKVVRLLHTFSTECGGQLTTEEKDQIRQYVKEQSSKTNGEGNLAERLGLSLEEVSGLTEAVA